MASRTQNEKTAHSRRPSRSSTAAGGSLAMFDSMWPELLAKEARAIERERDPLQAEAWASALIGMLSGQELVGEVDTVTAIGRRLVGAAARAPSPAADLFLRAIAAVAPPQLAKRARSALLATPGAAARSLKSWTRIIGTAEPTSAWRASDLCGDQDSLMIGFRYPGPDPREHSLVVLVDHLLGGIAKDVGLLDGAIDDVLTFWRGTDGMILVEESVPQAATLVSEALDLTSMTLDPPVTEDYQTYEALAHARLAPLAATEQPDRPTTSDDEREELVRAFLSDAAGARFAHDTGAWFLLDALVDFRCGSGGDPLKWSGGAAELFLLDWVPRKLSGSQELLGRAGEVLRAWIPWAAARAGLPETVAAETLELLDELGGEPVAALSDTSRWGPAKRAVMQMLEDGVDVTDEAAVGRWIASQRRRPAGVA